MSQAALAFLEDGSAPAKRDAVVRYRAARKAARERIASPFWEYYEYQASEDGVARWTETRFGLAAGASDPPLMAAATDMQAGLAASLRAIERTGLPS